MESKVWYNREDYDKYVYQARQEMDQKMRDEREQIDTKVKQERASVDDMINQERENIRHKLQQMHEEMDKNLLREREKTDENLKHERAAMYRTVDQIHEEMDRKLHKKRKDMDLIVHQKRAKMDFKTMQTRVDMDKKVQEKLEQECKDKEYKAMLEQVQREAKVMEKHARVNTKEECHIPLPEPSISYSAPDMGQKLKHEHEDIPSQEQPLSYSPMVPIMEFRVFKDREFSDIPQGYHDLPGFKIFNEPLTKVEWSEFLYEMHDFGYRSCSHVYYIKPESVPPQELVLLSCQEDLDQVMRAHEGTKKCDLYIVTNCPSVYDSDDNDMRGEDPYESGWDDGPRCLDIGPSCFDEDRSSPRMN